MAVWRGWGVAVVSGVAEWCGVAAGVWGVVSGVAVVWLGEGGAAIVALLGCGFGVAVTWRCGCAC